MSETATKSKTEKTTGGKITNVYPKSILVSREQDGDYSYLLAHEDTSGIPHDQDGELVGIYELKEIKRFSMTRTLDAPTPEGGR